MIEIAPMSENEMSYDEALLYCQFCNHNGYTDWRMPTRIECLQYTTHVGCWHTNATNSPLFKQQWHVVPVRDI